MADTEPMNVNERWKSLHKMRIHYRQGQEQKARSALLDDMAAVTNLDGNSLIRLSFFWREAAAAG